MTGASGTLDRLFTLPARFIGGDGVAGRWRVEVGDAVRDVVIQRGRCRVEWPSAELADAHISTDPGTWEAIDEGRSSGIEAFTEERLWVRGSIQRALEFEPLFERPRAGGLRYEVRDVIVGGRRINTLFAGDFDREPVLLLHGLGATKSAWLTIVPQLARRHYVIVVDLPGFGYSSKPRAPYDAPFFAREMFRFLDALGIRSTCVGGNSMGGRIAMEMAMHAPERVNAIACLCPATAFARRRVLLLVRLLRPELAVAGLYLPRERVRTGLKMLFADSACLDDRWYDAAIDEFLTMWKMPQYRFSFAAAARRIYLEEPTGETGFWARLAAMQTPAFYVYGSHDVLIKARYEREVTRALPHARVEVWEQCGHVPQIEFPERTASRLLEFFAERDTAQAM